MVSTRDITQSVCGGGDLLDLVKRSILGAVKPRRIIVFGSRARGEERPGSDIDLLIVVDPGSDVDAVRVAVRKAIRHIRVPKDVVVITRDVFDTWTARRGNLIGTAATGGVVLHESP